MKLLKERLQLFRHYDALGGHCRFFEYTPCIGERNRVEESIAQLDRLKKWTSTVLICLTRQKRREDHRQKMYSGTYASYETATYRQLVGRVSYTMKAKEPF